MGKKNAKRVSGKTNPLFVSRRKNFGIGQDVLPKKDLTRYVKWPKYIMIQRQKKILMDRLKVPGSLNQFRHHL